MRDRSLVRRRAAPKIVTSLLIVGAACGGETVARTDLLGFRAGPGFFDAESFDAAESELGANFTYTVQFTDRRSDEAMNRSAFGLLAASEAELPDVAGELDLVLSVPLAFGTADAETGAGRDRIAQNLADVVDGEHDDSFTRLAERLVDAGYADAIIRLGHDFNDSMVPWSSRTNEEAFMSAWRRVHGLMTAVSPDFSFDWTAQRRSWFDWGLAAYPGDEFVDIVGMSVFWRAQRQDQPWDISVWDQEYLAVLRDHLAFAVEHGKDVSYPEWALSGADIPTFIEAMADWIDEVEDVEPGRLRYHAYFDDGEQTTLTTYPKATAAFTDRFGSA